MKISKVDHTKSAVAKNKGEIQGILYQDPRLKEELKEDLQERFSNLNHNAQRLYKILNQVQVGEKPKKDNLENYNQRCRYEGIVNGKDGLNSELWHLFFIRQDNGLAVKDSEAVLEYLPFWNLQVKGEEVSNDDLDGILTLYLRKSLRKGEAGLRTLLRNSGNTDISQEDQEKISEFVTILKEDFTKLDYGKRIRKSIENQNMIVQPVKKGDKDLLSLPAKQDSQSGREKKAFSDFLTQYADLDLEKRKDLLRRLRRLVDLYFNVDPDADAPTIPEAVNKAPNYKVWEAHEAGKSNDGMFTEYPKELEQGDASKAGKKKMLDSVQARKARSGLKENIRKRNIECYRKSLAIIKENKELFFTDEELNHYWIHHIENAVERILSTTGNGKRLTGEKLRIGYLSEKVWKDCLNTMSIKYIAVGKAVYHFALDDLADTEKDTDLLKIADKAVGGITSFDYEEIKAIETLQREVAVDVSFAANNLSRATVDTSKGNEDFLVWESKNIGKNLWYKEDGRTLKAILQFFGGASRWNLDLFKDAYKDLRDYETYEIKFLDDLRKIIFSLRNKSFHFATQSTGSYDWNTNLIGEMFAQDAGVCVDLEKKKFYSNNLPMFYKASNLQKILDFLYKENPSRASQVPSFKTVFVRKNFPDFLDSHGFSFAGGDAETRLKWQNALYYLFKEIYYNAFLTSPDVKDDFFEALDGLPTENEDALALKDFRRRCRDFKNKKEYGLPEICQFIMTEYNEQNAGNRKVRSSKEDQRNPKIFQHYRLLLMRTLQSAFSIFLDRQDVLKVLKHPDGKRELMPETEFLSDWRSTMYQNTINAVKDSPELQVWYITARFLNARTLNLLVGSLRSYIQYARDVYRRAQETGNQVITYEKNTVQTCKKVLPVLDLCLKLSSVYSNELTDYFSDNEEYAKYLSKYVKFNDTNGNIGSAFAQLQAFCMDSKSWNNIYMDEMNPILNRNIVMSKLFGPDSILANTMSSVKGKDIRDYYNKQEKIADYMEKGKCSSKEEQESVIEYQRLKNHVELRDVVEFGEIINELLGQLINWSYLRERDLLYFQLGFHYLCLNNDDAKKPEGYIHITRENGTKINGAILSQVAGMYINGIPVFAPDETGKLTAQSIEGSAGKKIRFFYEYAGQILPGKGEALYNAGLELFETLREHKNVVHVRNAIDHFKYYTVTKEEKPEDGMPRSILDYYSEVFDRFFEYDMKYQKTVVPMLQNVLLRHFVLFFPSFSTGKKVVGSGEVKDRAQIGAQTNGISSDTLTYKIQDCSDLIIDAKSEKYREVIGKILYYPYPVPDGIIGGEHQEKGGKKENSRGKSERNPGKFRQGKKDREQAEKELNAYKKKNNTSESVGTSLAEKLKGLNLK